MGRLVQTDIQISVAFSAPGPAGTVWPACTKPTNILIKYSRCWVPARRSNCFWIVRHFSGCNGFRGSHEVAWPSGSSLPDSGCLQLWLTVAWEMPLIVAWAATLTFVFPPHFKFMRKTKLLSLRLLFSAAGIFHQGRGYLARLKQRETARYAYMHTHIPVFDPFSGKTIFRSHFHS